MSARTTLAGPAAASLMIAWIVAAPVASGQGHQMGKDALLVPPDPELAARYEKDASAIKSLQDAVKDGGRSEGDRMKDFRQLRARYPDAALVTAAAVVQDKSEKVATFAVGILGGAATMSDHKMPAGAHLSPAEAYMMRRHEIAREGLRTAQKDERAGVRNRATESLASLSDEVGLKNVADGAKAGRYSPLEAVNHFGLARREVGVKFLEPYLADKSPDVQAAAVAYLATVPELTQRVRDDLLYNADAALEVRLAAAKRLAKDADTALRLLGSDDTPPELFQEVFAVYLGAKVRPFTEAELKSLQKVLERFKKAHPNADYKRLDDLFKRLHQANSK